MSMETLSPKAGFVVSKNGYSGGCGGKEFLDNPPSGMNGVDKVIIRSGRYVDSLQMVVKLDKGTYELARHGGSGGARSEFNLSEGEYITQISGSYGGKVDSILFGTNKRTSKEYGGEGGCAHYSYEAPEGYEIVGFYGRSGSLIDAVGIVLSKLK